MSSRSVVDIDNDGYRCMMNDTMADQLMPISRDSKIISWYGRWNPTQASILGWQSGKAR